MWGARDFPRVRRFSVRRADCRLPSSDFSLRDHLEELCVFIEPWSSAADAHEKAIVELRMRLDTVVVPNEEICRLRRPSSIDTLHTHPFEGVDPLGMLEHLGHLGVDVVRLRIVRDGASIGHVERRISRRAPLLQAAACERAGGAEAMHADALHRGAHPGPAGANKKVPRLRPFRIEIAPSGHVLPVDDHHTAETLGVRRPPHDDSGLIRHGPDGCRGSRLIGNRITRRRARDEVLLLHVPHLHQGHRRGVEDVVVCRVTGSSCRRDGSADNGIRDDTRCRWRLSRRHGYSDNGHQQRHERRRYARATFLWKQEHHLTLPAFTRRSQYSTSLIARQKIVGDTTTKRPRAFSASRRRPILRCLGTRRYAGSMIPRVGPTCGDGRGGRRADSLSARWWR